MVENDTATAYHHRNTHCRRRRSVGGFGVVLGGNSKFLLDDTLAGKAYGPCLLAIAPAQQQHNAYFDLLAFSFAFMSK